MKILAHVVTFQSERTIAPCVRSLLKLTEKPRIVIRDNASTDGTLGELAQFHTEITVISNQENLGFCRAHNDGITDAIRSGCDFIFLVNPDLRVNPDMLTHLLRALREDSACGMATPKLLRADDALEPVVPPTVDAAGMFITPSIRHFDRGSGEIDRGQYEREQYVFGGTGAALLLSRGFIEDVSRRAPDDRIELFDEKFFAYREDADLAWRAERAGWRTRYVPAAIGYHVRRVLPERRNVLPQEINAMGVRNRFLLQRNNLSLRANWRNLPALMFRNAVVTLGVLLRERTSLPALLQGRTLPAWRTKRRVSALALSRWFKPEPYTEPALVRSDSPRDITAVEAIIVNFNSGQRLQRSAQALLDARSSLRFSLAVTVVDNASSDGSAAHLPGGARLIASDTNLGFAGALNCAMEQSQAQAFLILNPDVTASANAISCLVETLSLHDRLGIVAPVLTDESASVQDGFTVRRLPSVLSTLLEMFGLHRLKTPWTRHYLTQDDARLCAYLHRDSRRMVPELRLDAPYAVEQPAGACLLIDRHLINELGGLDTQFWPAWFEDVDLCKRTLERGWSIALDGRARVIHEGGYSTRVIPRHRFAKYWYSNQLRYWRKHGSPAEYALLRALFIPALLLRSLLCLAGSFRLALPERERDRQLAAELLRLAFLARA